MPHHFQNACVKLVSVEVFALLAAQTYSYLLHGSIQAMHSFCRAGHG